MLFHKISFNSAIGASSTSLKFIFFDRFAPYDIIVFFTFTSTIGFR